jgi:hypothetical protein
MECKLPSIQTPPKTKDYASKRKERHNHQRKEGNEEAKAK